MIVDVGRGRLEFFPERATDQQQAKIIQSIKLKGLNKITLAFFRGIRVFRVPVML